MAEAVQTAHLRRPESGHFYCVQNADTSIVA
jgi:hypothetical protein